jgi:hypothetical protein
MSRNWGPHFIVPSEVFENYSGSVLLREEELNRLRGGNEWSAFFVQ